MPGQSIAYSTPPAAPRWQRWLVFSPVARIALFALLLVAIGYAVHAVVAALGWNAGGANQAQRVLASASMRLLPPVLAYLVLVQGIERRPVDELSPRDLPVLGGAGCIVGALLFSLVVGVLWLAGSYHVEGVNGNVNWIPAVLVGGVGAGIGEEIVMRGVLFRVVEEGAGTWWALAVSALVFGAAHIANPAATVWSSLAIAIEAGVLLALVFQFTRSLWACAGLHAAWNVMQGTVYGIPVSGGKADGWLVSTRSGPGWLSGGAFGAEASVVAVAACSALSLALLVIILRRRAIVPPRWRRPAADAA